MAKILDLGVHITTTGDRKVLSDKIREIVGLIEGGRMQEEHEYRRNVPMAYRFNLEEDEE